MIILCALCAEFWKDWSTRFRQYSDYLVLRRSRLQGEHRGEYSSLEVLACLTRGEFISKILVFTKKNILTKGQRDKETKRPPSDSE